MYGSSPSDVPSNICLLTIRLSFVQLHHYYWPPHVAQPSTGRADFERSVIYRETRARDSLHTGEEPIKPLPHMNGNETTLARDIILDQPLATRVTDIQTEGGFHEICPYA